MTLTRWILLGLVAGAIGGYLSTCTAQVMQFYNFDNSPSNFKNSPYNFDNSPSNFNNSPLNFNNSPMNSQATNGVFDSNGNRIGYTTVSPQGVVNIFDNDGNRLGYSPQPYAPVRIGK